MTILGVAAAKQWLHQLRATKSDKVSKCFRTVVSRQINPLFVVIQVAALQHKVCQDMLS